MPQIQAIDLQYHVLIQIVLKTRKGNEMKTYLILLFLLLVMSIHAFGQEGIARSQNLSGRKQELEAARNSDYIDTFAEAFNDPNVFIGVFERSKVVPNVIPVTTLSSGEILEELPEYLQAMKYFHLPHQFKCVKSIKGEFTEPMVFVFDPPYIMMERRKLPTFVPLPETKWILALKKTTHEYRAERIKSVEDYKFFNDETVFSLFHWGHGALCLQWPEKEMEPQNMVKVSEDFIPDLQAIEKAMPHVQKKQRESSDTAAIEKTKNALKTNKAKAIFDELLQKQQELAQSKDPNQN